MKIGTSEALSVARVFVDMMVLISRPDVRYTKSMVRNMLQWAVAVQQTWTRCDLHDEETRVLVQVRLLSS